MSRYRFELAINADSPERAQEIVEATKKAVNEQRGFDISALFGDLRTEEGQQVRTGGCWIAFHSDWTCFAIFDTELDALRFAVEHSMNVEFREWGEVAR